MAGPAPVSARIARATTKGGVVISNSCSTGARGRHSLAEAPCDRQLPLP